MSNTTKHVCLISCALLLLALQCAADVNSIVSNNRRQFQTRRNQAQRLTEADQTAYPAVGFRPERPFQLPNAEQQTNNFNQETVPTRPDNSYAVPVLQQQRQQQQKPARLQQPQQQQQPLVRQQQQQQPLVRQQQKQQEFIYPQYILPQSQQHFQLGPQKFPNPQSEPARLIAEPEEQEVVDNNSDDIEVNVENAAEEVPRSAVASPLPPPQATVTYFPANAINFVKPFHAGVATSNPGGTFIQYQPNVLSPHLAKVVAANSVGFPISAQYYSSNTFLPSTASFNSYAAFPRMTAPLQAW